MLSATVPNTLEFADWVGRQRESVGVIRVISTTHRPVPLEHHLYHQRRLFPVVDRQGKFSEEAYRGLLQSVRGGQSQAHLQTGSNPVKSPLNATSRTTATSNTVQRQQGTLWNDLIHHQLKKNGLLPAVCFVFSRRGCEDAAEACQSMVLTDASERSAIHRFIQESLDSARLSPSDRLLPQVQRMQEMAERGIAVHHSGVLPILKEAVEILFSRGLIRILFATETFAMGVNMPARTAVFLATRKHDGRQFRSLTPGEYTQMAGRAGRRGKDTVGTVVIISPEDPPPSVPPPLLTIAFNANGIERACLCRSPG